MSAFTREDFEHAARAAGVVLDQMGTAEAAGAFAMLPNGEIWNPRDNNGEAMVLAVILRLSITPKPLDWCVSVSNFDGSVIVDEECSDSEITTQTTRHAIFRAAIAIGKAMLAKGE